MKHATLLLVFITASCGGRDSPTDEGKAFPRGLIDTPGPGSALLRQLEQLEYPYCGVTFHEAFGDNAGHVTSDGCSVYWNPSLDGPTRFGELLEEAIHIRSRNIAANPELYGRPRR